MTFTSTKIQITQTMSIMDYRATDRTPYLFVGNTPLTRDEAIKLADELAHWIADGTLAAAPETPANTARLEAEARRNDDSDNRPQRQPRGL